MPETNSLNQQRMEKMEFLLNRELSPSFLEIQDDSHLHAGHAGALTGKAHFTVNVKSQQFDGVRTLKQHQMIYQALGAMMQEDIHALVIKATI